MSMMDADEAAYTGRLTIQVGWLGLPVGGHAVLSLHSSNDRVNSCNGFAMTAAP